MSVLLRLAAALPAHAPLDVPVDPDAPDAKKWLLDELAKADYAAARPTLIDRIAKAIQDWLNSLTVSGDGSSPSIFPLVATLLIVGLIVAAFIVFGRPRLRRRSTLTGALFADDDDGRTAAQLRESAERAAAAGDLVTAIEEMFRSIARQLAERTVLAVSPGTTAHEFARRAGVSFPGYAARLGRGAAVFDGVRYLDAVGNRAEFDEIATLERELRQATPARLEQLTGAGTTQTGSPS
jgi:hypothetical protein